MFNRTGDVIFGVSLEQVTSAFYWPSDWLKEEQEMEDETKYESFDAGDYSQIATIETKKSVLNLCSSLTIVILQSLSRLENVLFELKLKL